MNINACPIQNAYRLIIDEFLLVKYSCFFYMIKSQDFINRIYAFQIYCKKQSCIEDNKINIEEIKKIAGAE